MTPTIDVVIVSYRTKDALVDCLTSLFAHRPAALGVVHLVDNASGDGSVEAVRAAWPVVRVTALDTNVGFGAANNVALRMAQASLVLLLNSDTIVPAGAIDRLVERLTTTGATAAGPRLVDTHGRPEISFGPMLSPAREILQRARVRAATRSNRWSRAWVARLTGRERFVDWVSGACLLVRRPEAQDAGFFDERFFLYEEDVDFCAALRARGGRILFTPRAEIVHRRGLSGEGGAARVHYDRSHLAFYAKHAPRWVPWLNAWQRLTGRPVR